MYQLEEHVTYLVCEVELKKKKRKKKNPKNIYTIFVDCCLHNKPGM